MCGHNCTIAKVKLIPGLLLAGLLLAEAAWAQPVSVYSEFARINAAGDVTDPEAPREILSPAVVRNGFTSFQVVVQAPADKTWWLFIGQNPGDTFKLTMYRESGDSFEPVELPRMSSGTEVLWLDVWADATTRVQRVKLEPELNINDDWVTYPIEARVTEARVPDMAPTMQTGCPFLAIAELTGTAALHQRNAFQDDALATIAPKDELAKLLGSCDPGAPSNWTEGYLRIRDYLFRLR